MGEVMMESTFKCAECDDESTVWFDDAKGWMGLDLRGRKIIFNSLERDIVRDPPLPAGWIEFAEKFICPHHDFVRNKSERRDNVIISSYEVSPR